ncbi:DUF4124 domain-containing protein [Halioglobus maricola]|nr:DUF4124 domain-containing protein [Halioglobus maricola]
MRILFAMICLLAGTVTLAQQATVYKTVDDEGVVSFSDTPPASDAGVETVVVDAPAVQADGVYEDNLEAMRETTDRLAEDRMAREKHRAEMREMAARTDAYGGSQQQVVEYDSSPNMYTSGSYYGSGYYRPDYPLRPVHPIVRPPLRPRPPAVQPQRPTHHNSQLMRPMTSR